MNKTAPIFNKIKKDITTIKKDIKKKNKTSQNFRRKRRRRRLKKQRARLPAAFTKSFSRFFKIVKQDGNSMTVKGRDLVYSIPDNIESQFQDTNVITVIPCNPCYWTGTRISAIANGYQNYRPLKFNVYYIPQCAVTQQGNVISGTIWNQAPTSDNLQQSLRTSSGGMLTQCYKTARSVVSMRSNLQFNLFRCGGKFDQESNPFIYVSLAIGCVDEQKNKIVPGYFYVDWEYSFKNPIGYSISYLNKGIDILTAMNITSINTTLVSCQSLPDKNIEVGMLIQVDKDQDDNYIFTYNNTVLDINEETPLICWLFANKPLNQIQTRDELVPTPIPKTYIFTYKVLSHKNVAGNVSVNPGLLVFYNAAAIRTVKLFYNATNSDIEIFMPADTDYYYGTIVDCEGTNFGTLIQTQSDYAGMISWQLFYSEIDHLNFIQNPNLKQVKEKLE